MAEFLTQARGLTLVLTASLLSACLSGGGSGGSSGGAGANPEPALQVQALDTGRYAVITGTEQEPVYGNYYAGPGDNRILVLNDDQSKANSLFRQVDGGSWQGVSPQSFDDIQFLQVISQAAVEASLNELQGDYVTEIERGLAASISLAADGRIDAGLSSTCQLSGQLSDSGIAGSLNVQLSASNCGALSGELDGVLLVDPDYSPASFRLVLENGSQVFDLWFYAD